MNDVYGLTLQVLSASDDDLDELVKFTDRLQSELLELDVLDAGPVDESTAPDQAKGLATVTGWLVVHLGSLSGLRAVVTAVRDWAARNNREVELTIDGDTLRATRISAAQQEKVIDAWLARHAPSS
jgi:hypothetical protein